MDTTTNTPNIVHKELDVPEHIIFGDVSDTMITMKLLHWLAVYLQIFKRKVLVPSELLPSRFRDQQ